MGRRRRHPPDAAGKTTTAAGTMNRQVRREGTRAPSLATLACLAVLTSAGTVAYWPSLTGVFLLDDISSIATNPTIRRLWPLSRHLSVPQEATVSGRPAVNFSLALNYALAPADAREVFNPVVRAVSPDVEGRFLRNVWGYHALNLLVHLAAGCVLFGVLRRTLVTTRMRRYFGGSAATSLSLVIATLWLVHPLQTAAVTYVVQRVESMMGFFYLLTLYCAIRAGEGVHGRWWALGAVAACALGMGSKETMVSAPLVVACWDWVFGPRPRSSARWPLYAGLASTWVVLVACVAQENRPHSVGIDLGDWTPWTYLVTQAGVILHYLRLAFVPSPLVFLYSWPMAPSIGAVLPQFVLIVLLVAGTVVGLSRRHPLGFAGAWFFAILAPSSSLLPIITEVAAEHRMYLPLAAVVASCVIGAYILARSAMAVRLRRRPTAFHAGAHVMAIGLVAVLAVTLSVRTRDRNRDYWSLQRIWSDTVAKQPDNPRGRIGYGISLMAEGQYERAEQELRTAVTLDGRSPVAHGQLGATLLALGRIDDSVPHLEKALAIWPDYADAHRSLGLAYAARGDEQKAFTQLAHAVQAFPDDPRVLVPLARIAATSDHPALRFPPLALELCERAVRATGRQDARLLAYLAAALDAMDRKDEATATIVEAARLARSQGDLALAAELERRK